MNTEKEKKLYSIGKVLYARRKLSEMESCMPFGFTCGNGWYEPLKKLTVELEKMNNELSKYDICIEADQVKEKFGFLNFYFDICEKKLIRPFRKYDRMNDNMIDFAKKNNKKFYYKYMLFQKINFLIFKYNAICNFINKIYIKSKKKSSFGIQRDYYSKVQKAIDEAREECSKRCEKCGCSDSPESPLAKTTDWIRIICRKCNQQREIMEK